MDRKISIIAIGDEVLCGVTLNGNATCIADVCVQNGVFPATHIVTSDDPKDISEAIAHELRLGRDVICTGGLGPTIDDHTRAVVAQLFSRPLVRNEKLFFELSGRYGKDFPTLENQSLQPEGACLLNNTVGTAPGLLLEDETLFPQARLFVLPGPPQEMRDVLFHEVVPRFLRPKKRLSRVFRLIHVNESEIDLLWRSISLNYPKVIIGIYPSYELVRVHLSVLEESDELMLEEASAIFSSAFPKQNFLDGALSLEEALYHALRERLWKIATAESCTAGGLGAKITSVPGASEVFLGGIVAYQDGIKKSLLMVPEEVMNRYGVVSTEVTELMAKGAQTVFGAEVVCAVSGFFGPTGGSQAAPIGTVCASFIFPGAMFSERFFFHGTREAICEKTIQALLAKLVLRLQSS